jgi:hypothetical protein
MKRRYLLGALLAGLAIVAAWRQSRDPVPTDLMFKLGQTFDEVVRSSSYPAMEHANHPFDDPDKDMQFGAIWVTEPAVIIRFTDPKHGFTLPPTKFAALSFSKNKASSLATSPMLDALPFDDAIARLENLQNQFKAGGWQPWEKNGSVWFDLSPEGKKRLYARMFEPGYAQEATLRIPKLYAMTFRLKCHEGCWTREPPYLFLIDIGLSDDVFGWMPGEPEYPQAATGWMKTETTSLTSAASSSCTPAPSHPPPDALPGPGARNTS